MGYTPPGALFVRKTADETVTSSNVLQDDDELKIPLLPNSIYEFELCAFFDAATTGDIKAAFTVPAGSVIICRTVMPASAASSAPVTMVSSVMVASGAASNASGGIGAGAKAAYGVRGTVITGGTAGNLQFQFAQSVSDPTATTVFTNSYLKATRVG